MKPIKKGICLSGGVGSRLFPLTKSVSKQLLGLYNKPVIAYPLQTLKDMGFVDILIITANEEQQNSFKKLLGDGNHVGLNLSYEIQGSPRGLADAFIVGADFIKDADTIAMILGDNVIIREGGWKPTNGNTIYTYKVQDPSQYGVVVTDESGRIQDFVEKPTEYISDQAIIGLYIFNNSVIDMAKKVKPSKRGELEIVDLIKLMNGVEGVKVESLDGFWFDIGDHDSLLDCANLIRTIDKRSNHVIGLEGL